jgi:hypothetical protein
MLFREIIDLYAEIYKELINALCGHNSDLNPASYGWAPNG